MLEASFIGRRRNVAGSDSTRQRSPEPQGGRENAVKTFLTTTPETPIRPDYTCSYGPTDFHKGICQVQTEWCNGAG